MSFLEWTRDLDTGIDKIDTEHRQIVDYINRLHDAQQSGDRAVTTEVMDALVEYTITHFAGEEAMMEKAGYPLTDAHKGVHRRFVEKVSRLQADHNAGTDTAESLLSLLETWLFSHIRMNDHGYVPTVTGKA